MRERAERLNCQRPPQTSGRRRRTWTNSGWYQGCGLGLVHSLAKTVLYTYSIFRESSLLGMNYSTRDGVYFLA